MDLVSRLNLKLVFVNFVIVHYQTNFNEWWRQDQCSPIIPFWQWHTLCYLLYHIALTCAGNKNIHLFTYLSSQKFTTKTFIYQHCMHWKNNIQVYHIGLLTLVYHSVANTVELCLFCIKPSICEAGRHYSPCKLDRAFVGNQWFWIMSFWSGSIVF